MRALRPYASSKSGGTGWSVLSVKGVSLVLSACPSPSPASTAAPLAGPLAGLDASGTGVGVGVASPPPPPQPARTDTQATTSARYAQVLAGTPRLPFLRISLSPDNTPRPRRFFPGRRPDLR